MEKYLITKNELLGFLRYEILYKWEQWQKETDSEDKNFSEYLIKNTPYQPYHELIQSFCITKEEKEDPILNCIYKQILPADVARYQAATLYQPYVGD